MKLKQLTVAGFRGFNSTRTIDFHDKLTLISAPNSHGKTSITEALEFLLYGQTSKVESADSKDEYKGSYGNRHYQSGDPAFVEVRCVDTTAGELVLRVEADGQDIQRYVNGQPVPSWPFAAAMINTARPFVVQHALKSLLLAPPSGRFQGFARLLGLQDIDERQQALVNLCTKPEAHLSPQAKKLLVDLTVFDSRLRGINATTSIAKALSQGVSGVDEAYRRLHSRGVALVGKNTPESDLSAALVSLRNAAAAKVYSGSVSVAALSSGDSRRAANGRRTIESLMTPTFLEDYTRLAVGDTADRLRKEAQVLGLGLELLEDAPDECPLCKQVLTEAMRSHLRLRHESLRSTLGPSVDLSTARARMLAVLKEVSAEVSAHSALQARRSAELIAANEPEASQKIVALFGKGNEHNLFLIAAAGAAITPHYNALLTAASKTTVAIEVCSDAIQAKAEDLAQFEAAVSAAMVYLQSSEAYEKTLEDVGPTLAEPTRLLQEAVDAQAGTTEFSLLIEMLSSRTSIRRAVRLKVMLDGLKGLRKHIDQAVGQTMEDAFAKDLTGAVMGWYQKIRTTSDPDVHFSGFAMERTKGGDFKNRRVKVGAKSYGVELVSAVSSLSESKLNALGLCMSIATALRAPGPWEFLMLDDPIQSWDDDHEVQFISIIRELAETEGRQIILMSHRERWIDQVATGCRSLNGARYHITGYTKDGPAIHCKEWATIDQRLLEALAIAKDPNATPVRLQQAEEEIRIAVCQLTADVARGRLGRATGARGINSERARAILTEAGCPAALVDRVIATFSTTDPAHHAPKDYAPNAERIRQYHWALVSLRSWMKT